MGCAGLLAFARSVHYLCPDNGLIMSKKKVLKGRPFVGKDATHFGRNLRAVRDGTGFSQEQMAEFFAIERATYQTYESGNNHPNPLRMIAMCDALGRTVDEMIRGPLKVRAQAKAVHEAKHAYAMRENNESNDKK